MKIELILSIVLASCTLVYTIINYKLLVESRETRKQKLTPIIVAFLKSAENHIMLELHFKNIGEGMAKNVRINVLKDFNQFGKENLLISDLGIMKNGFNSFPPQYELKFYLKSMVDLYKENKEDGIKLEIFYESSDKRKFHDVFDLTFNQLFGQNYSSPPETYMGQIPFYLKEISSILKKD